MGRSNLMTKPSETRQDQLLQAAARCFVDEGFHGASMSRIAKAAQMSPGHIYHYFDSKEAIIIEIVRRDCAQAKEFFASLKSLSGEDLKRTLSDGIKEKVEGVTDKFESALTLEVLAEASRNEAVQDIIRDADQQIKAMFAEALETKLGIPDAGHRVEILFALIAGLTTRIVRNPDIDREGIAEQLKLILHSLLTP